MSFDASVPELIKTIERQRAQFVTQRLRLVHDCDCDYCDFDGVNDEDQPEYDKLTEHIEDCERSIKKLEDWKKFKEGT